MKTNRKKVIIRLKAQANKHYDEARKNSDMSCGGDLCDYIRGTNTSHHFDEFERCLRRLRRIDHNFPGR